MSHLAGGRQGALGDLFHRIEPRRAFAVTLQFLTRFDKDDPKVPSADANMPSPWPKPGAALAVMSDGNCVKPKGS